MIDKGGGELLNWMTPSTDEQVPTRAAVPSETVLSGLTVAGDGSAGGL